MTREDHVHSVTIGDAISSSHTSESRPPSPKRLHEALNRQFVQEHVGVHVVKNGLVQLRHKLDTVIIGFTNHVRVVVGYSPSRRPCEFAAVGVYVDLGRVRTHLIEEFPGYGW